MSVPWPVLVVALYVVLVLVYVAWLYAVAGAPNVDDESTSPKP